MSLDDSCAEMEELGSDPGSVLVWCERPKGHDGPHSATIDWPQKVTE